MLLITIPIYFLLIHNWILLTEQSIGVDLSISDIDWVNVFETNPDTSFIVVHSYFYNGTINSDAVPAIRSAKAAGVADISLYMYPCISSSIFIEKSQYYCGSAEDQLNYLVDYLNENQIYFQNFSVNGLDVYSPTLVPTAIPTALPTFAPTTSPTPEPTYIHTAHPTVNPSITPSYSPSTIPSELPSAAPTVTDMPTFIATLSPTAEPSEPEPTVPPTEAPSYNLTVTDIPTAPPTMAPSENPSAVPTFSPTVVPTDLPSEAPTETPSAIPTNLPTATPTQSPTISNVITVKRLFVNIEDETPNRFFSSEHYQNVQYMANLANAAAQKGIQLGIYTTRKDWYNVMADKLGRLEPYVYPVTNSTYTATNPFNRLPLWVPRYDGLNSMDFYSEFGNWSTPFMKQTTGGSTLQRREGSDRICTNYIDDAAGNGTTSYDNQIIEFVILT